jgi:hypothetical protein
MRALWIYYARLFLLRPVLFPGCYGHVYVLLTQVAKNHFAFATALLWH